MYAHSVPLESDVPARPWMPPSLTPKVVPSLRMPIPKITDFGCES